MISLVSRFLKTPLTVGLLVSFSLIATVVEAPAQSASQHKSPSATALRFRGPWRGLKHPFKTAAAPTSSPTWSPVFSTVSNYEAPPLRAAHSAVYDSSSNELIVFGGYDGDFNNSGLVLIETNANGSGGYFGGMWSNLVVNSIYTPPARYFHTAVYDQANNRMIVFGGCADYECLVALNDVWVLSDANGVGGTQAWTELTPTGTLPVARASHNAVYDAVNNRMIIYSGNNGTGNTSYSDVWVLSNANGLGGTPAWTQLTPSGNTPDAYDGSAAVYDPNTNTMIVTAGGNFVNSVWTLSNANGLNGTPAWTTLIATGAAGAPPVRIGPQAIYDATNNRLTLFGGEADAGVNNPDFDYVGYNDAWVLANANGTGGTPTWTQLHPKVAGDHNIPPAGREFFTAASDPTTNSMIIYGGDSIEGMYLSTWVLSHANGL